MTKALLEAPVEYFGPQSTRRTTVQSTQLELGTQRTNALVEKTADAVRLADQESSNLSGGESNLVVRQTNEARLSQPKPLTQSRELELQSQQTNDEGLMEIMSAIEELDQTLNSVIVPEDIDNPVVDDSKEIDICAECGVEGATGAFDDGNGEFYCNSCWLNYDVDSTLADIEGTAPPTRRERQHYDRTDQEVACEGTVLVQQVMNSESDKLASKYQVRRNK